MSYPEQNVKTIIKHSLSASITLASDTGLSVVFTFKLNGHGLAGEKIIRGDVLEVVGVG